MAHQPVTHRFGPDIWATVGSTGEHVKVELWSDVANAYRVRSAGNGVQFFQESELEEVTPYPDDDFTRHWSRCRATACGAPLTAALATCEKCQGRICTCGRCACPPGTGRRSKAKKATKSKSKKSSAKLEVQAAEAATEEAGTDLPTEP